MRARDLARPYPVVRQDTAAMLARVAGLTVADLLKLKTTSAVLTALFGRRG